LPQRGRRQVAVIVEASMAAWHIINYSTSELGY
jgi:hypothetical protein